MIMIPGQKIPRLPSAKGAGRRSARQTTAGAEFDQTAQVYSEDSTRDGGDWGSIERNTLPAP